MCTMAGEVFSSLKILFSSPSSSFLRPKLQTFLLIRGWKSKRNLGLVVRLGHEVHPGQILMIQKKLRVHPGLNVGLGRNLNLFALETGRTVMTCEKAQPNWDNVWIQKFYSNRQGQQPFYKIYLHIIAPPQEQNFRLVNQI